MVDLLVQLDANGYGPKDVLFQQIKDDHTALVESVQALTTAFYTQHLNYVALENDTAHLLDHLERNQMPWGIVTNGSANEMLKIQKLGLDARTSCIFASEMVGVRQPASAVFLRAAACMQIELGKILFVGDHPEADIAGARVTGMRTAWLRRGRRWPESETV
ncbi:MAG: HAD family hydrolase [Chloroflexota bacterium]|nr:HAD family hydrolase [Chloroflexota bacterium]